MEQAEALGGQPLGNAEDEVVQTIGNQVLLAEVLLEPLVQLGPAQHTNADLTDSQGSASSALRRRTRGNVQGCAGASPRLKWNFLDVPAGRPHLQSIQLPQGPHGGERENAQVSLPSE